MRDLWWLGLPPGVRGEVWKKALGNDLNISPGEVIGKDLKFSFVLNGGWAEREDEISSFICCQIFRFVSYQLASM